MSAVISPCGLYRYRLDRTVGEAFRTCVFVMLNPSTADAELDDPTIRRCKGFALRENCGRLIVVNLFGFRATKPADLYKATVRVGSENDGHIKSALEAVRTLGGVVLCGWGANPVHGRDVRLMWLARSLGVSLHCLGKTKSGAPKHPLYIKCDAALETYWSAIEGAQPEGTQTRGGGEDLWIGVDALGVPDLATLHVDEADCLQLIDKFDNGSLTPRRCRISILEQAPPDEVGPHGGALLRDTPISPPSQGGDDVLADRLLKILCENQCSALRRTGKCSSDDGACLVEAGMRGLAHKLAAAALRSPPGDGGREEALESIRVIVELARDRARGSADAMVKNDLQFAWHCRAEQCDEILSAIRALLNPSSNGTRG